MRKVDKCLESPADSPPYLHVGVSYLPNILLFPLLGGPIFLQITEILKKPTESRTDEDRRVLEQSPDIVKSAVKRANSRQLNKQRQQEVALIYFYICTT